MACARMYSTKHKVHNKADQGQLSISAGGAKAGAAVGKDDIDRFKGKQMSIPRTNKPFSTFSFTVAGKQDPYAQGQSYRNVARKLGFGSSDPPKRDEFSNTIAIEQYREAIYADTKSANAAKAKASKAPKAGGDEALPRKAVQAKPETFEFDQAHVVKHDVLGKVRTWKKMVRGRDVGSAEWAGGGRVCAIAQARTQQQTGAARWHACGRGHGWARMRMRALSSRTLDSNRSTRRTLACTARPPPRSAPPASARATAPSTVAPMPASSSTTRTTCAWGTPTCESRAAPGCAAPAAQNAQPSARADIETSFAFAIRPPYTRVLACNSDEPPGPTAAKGHIVLPGRVGPLT